LRCRCARKKSKVPFCCRGSKHWQRIRPAFVVIHSDRGQIACAGLLGSWERVPAVVAGRDVLLQNRFRPVCASCHGRVGTCVATNSAIGRSIHFGSGTPITAASATPGCATAFPRPLLFKSGKPISLFRSHYFSSLPQCAFQRILPVEQLLTLSLTSPHTSLGMMYLPTGMRLFQSPATIFSVGARLVSRLTPMIFASSRRG
jgi:hypothetical protein